MNLSLFPDVLWLGAFFTPLLLRMSLGVLFLRLATIHIKNKVSVSTQSTVDYPLIKKYLIFVTIAIESSVTLFLFIGLYTQLITLVGTVYCLISIYNKEKVGTVLYSRSLYFLMTAVLLSLFFTGAGPLAFDVPL